MKTFFSTLLLGSSLLYGTAHAVIFPEITPEASILFKGHSRCGDKKIGKQKKTITIKNLNEDGSYKTVEKDIGFNGFSLWSIKESASVSKEEREKRESLLEGTNCFNVNGSLIDIKIGEEAVPTCMIRFEYTDKRDTYSFAAGYSIPVRMDTYIKHPTACDDYTGSVTIVTE